MISSSIRTSGAFFVWCSSYSLCGARRALRVVLILLFLWCSSCSRSRSVFPMTTYIHYQPPRTAAPAARHETLRPPAPHQLSPVPHDLPPHGILHGILHGLPANHLFSEVLDQFLTV